MLVLTHLLDVLQGDTILAQLLVDEDQGVEVAHTTVEQLVWEVPGPGDHPRVKLEQPGRKPRNPYSPQLDSVPAGTRA